MATNEPQGVERYYTDTEYLIDLFKSRLDAPELAKRLLIIHGVGGVGKSSLLRMFRLHCKNVAHVPVALASGDDAKSAMDVLNDWAGDLKADGITLATFGKTFEQYRTLQTKAENEAAKVADKALKGATKTIIETATSTIPGFGPLLGKLGGIGAEALIDWLRGAGFSKPDIDLLLDPAKKMTDDFLADLAKIAAAKRLVLILDTFEQMTALDDWTAELARKLGTNILLVIAGREMVNWDRQWNGWLAQADVHSLEPMTPEVMRELVQRYYSTQIGGEPDPAQVEKIIRFARGLPMAVTTAVRLWVKYRVRDFEEVEAGALNELVKRLREGVPPTLIPILDAAATMRYFNKPILRAVTALADVDAAYDELCRFPFMKSGKEGTERVWRLHDSVREFIDFKLQVDDPDRHRELHERAATYFEVRLAKASGDESERLGLERLYHRVRADEEAGIKLFQEMAEELTRYRLVNRLRALLNDVNTYPLEHENSKLWRKYYSARLMHFGMSYADAIEMYQAISTNEYSEPKLRAYALCDWGSILRHREYVRTSGGEEKAIQILESSLKQGANIDTKLATAWISIGDVFISKADWPRALPCLQKAQEFFSSRSEYGGILEVLRHEMGIYGRQGNFRGLDEIQQRIEAILNSLEAPSYLRLCSKPPFDWFWMGRSAIWEKGIRPTLSNARSSQDNQSLVWDTRDLGLALAMQGKCTESLQLLDESLSFARQLEDLGKLDLFLSMTFIGIGLCRCGNLIKAEENLVEALAVGKTLHAHLDATPCFLGIVRETLKQPQKAEDAYNISLFDARPIKRNFFVCFALTGLVRVKHTQGDYAAIPPLLAEAEQLAQQYEYNDHLASLRLTQAHLAWEGRGEVVSPVHQGEMTSPLQRAQHALIYALRYNRFLLDEVLSGRPQGTPLRPIIPYCLERGEEGWQMLTALRDWWKIGVNDIGTPRPDTISPIPEGITLLEAERIAREREPGDGSPQKSVLEQIENALAG